jgi:hypothetical protein
MLPKCLNLTPEFKGDYSGVKLICFVCEAQIQSELMATSDKNADTVKAKTGSYHG